MGEVLLKAGPLGRPTRSTRDRDPQGPGEVRLRDRPAGGQPVPAGDCSPAYRGAPATRNRAPP